MALQGPKDFPFDVDIKLDASINCTHTVTMLASEFIHILVGGLRVDRASFTFIEGEEFDVQSVTVYGPKIGTFPFKWEVTAPYMVVKGNPLPKKGDFGVTFDDSPLPDGWYGALHGARWGSGNSAHWTDANLHFMFTRPVSGGNVHVRFIVTGGPSNALAVVAIGPGGTVAFSVGSGYITFDTFDPGIYKFYVYTDAIFSAGGSGSLGTYTFEAALAGVVHSTKVVNTRGIRWKSDESMGGYPTYSNFTEEFGEQLYSYAPPTLNFAVTYWTNASYPWPNGYLQSPDPLNWAGSVMDGGNGPLTAIGQWELDTGPAYHQLVVTSQATTPSGTIISIQRTLAR